MLYKSANRCTLEWINNKVLLYSTESYMQYPVINRNEKEYMKKKMHICVYVLSESLCCTAKINTLSINYTSIKSIF